MAEETDNIFNLLWPNISTPVYVYIFNEQAHWIPIGALIVSLTIHGSRLSMFERKEIVVVKLLLESLECFLFLYPYPARVEAGTYFKLSMKIPSKSGDSIVLVINTWYEHNALGAMVDEKRLRPNKKGLVGCIKNTRETWSKNHT